MNVTQLNIIIATNMCVTIAHSYVLVIFLTQYCSIIYMCSIDSNMNIINDAISKYLSVDLIELPIAIEMAIIESKRVHSDSMCMTLIAFCVVVSLLVILNTIIGFLEGYFLVKQ